MESSTESRDVWNGISQTPRVGKRSRKTFAVCTGTSAMRSMSSRYCVMRRYHVHLPPVAGPLQISFLNPEGVTVVRHHVRSRRVFIERQSSPSLLRIGFIEKTTVPMQPKDSRSTAFECVRSPVMVKRVARERSAPSARREFVYRRIGVASGTSSRKASGSFRPYTISKSSDMETTYSVINVLSWGCARAKAPSVSATAGMSSSAKMVGTKPFVGWKEKGIHVGLSKSLEVFALGRDGEAEFLNCVSHFPC